MRKAKRYSEIVKAKALVQDAINDCVLDLIPYMELEQIQYICRRYNVSTRALKVVLATGTLHEGFYGIEFSMPATRDCLSLWNRNSMVPWEVVKTPLTEEEYDEWFA